MRISHGRAGLLAIPLIAAICSAPRAQAPSAAGPVTASDAPASTPFEVVRVDPALDQLLAPDTRLEVVATFPRMRGEGPIWHEGKLWLSEMASSQILEFTGDGHQRVIAEEAGGERTPGHPTLQGSNGLANWRNGSIVLARQGSRDVAVRYRDGRLVPLVAGLQGRRFNSPNDVVVGPDGAVWFTDPPLALAWHPLSRPAVAGTSPTAPGHVADQQIPFAGVYRLRHGVPTPVVTDMATPNGLAFSPDGRTLYVDNAYPDMYLRAYTVGRDGGLSNGREILRIPPDTGWGPGVPDGLKVDARGNLWMTGPGGLLILSPAGKLLGRIQLPARATNFTFGDDFRSLFIVASPNIYRLRTRVKGLVPPFTRLR